MEILTRMFFIRMPIASFADGGEGEHLRKLRTAGIQTAVIVPLTPCAPGSRTFTELAIGNA